MTRMGMKEKERNERRVDVGGVLVRDSLLLEVILTTASGLASWEGALVIALAGVDPQMTREVARGSERTRASGANVLLLDLFSQLPSLRCSNCGGINAHRLAVLCLLDCPFLPCWYVL